MFMQGVGAAFVVIGVVILQFMTAAAADRYPDRVRVTMTVIAIFDIIGVIAVLIGLKLWF